MVLLAQFRRGRQGTCSLLRSLPDDAWDLKGHTRQGPNVSIRELAQQLALHDYRYLRALDETLDQVGAREGLAEIQKTHLDELLKLVPRQVAALGCMSGRRCGRCRRRQPEFTCETDR